MVHVTSRYQKQTWLVLVFPEGAAPVSGFQCETNKYFSFS